VISLSAIAANYHVLAGRAGGARLMPVLKADGYGHGAVPIARRLVSEGADRFAVSIAAEGIALRRAGIAGEILLLNHSEPSDAATCQGYGLTATLYDLAQAGAYAEATRGFSQPLPVHLKIDTGMGRLGILPPHIGEMADLLRRSPGLALTGTLTQLGRADEADPSPTRRQIETMGAALETLRAAGLNPGLVHVANSAGVLWHPGISFDAVRPGIALYGISPSPSAEEPDLTPAMSLETSVMAVRPLSAGSHAGYGTAFTARRASTVAVLPIGYDDGLRRSFSGRVSVLLRGARAPIVGAVSMDMTLVDATDCGAAPGDFAVLLGSHGGERVTAWDLARAAATIPWEIVCGIGSRVPRVYS
jgi:alanine racemase